MSEPEPAPAGVADFVRSMPVQPPSTQSIMAAWMHVADSSCTVDWSAWPLEVRAVACGEPRSLNRLQTTGPGDMCAAVQDWSCPVRLPAFAVEFALQPPPAGAPEAIEPIPPECRSWMQPPQPEPVARFVRHSFAPAPAQRVRVPAFAPESRPLIPEPARAWQNCPGPEPVASFVQPSVALDPVRLIAPASLGISVPALHGPAPSGVPLRAPQAEPVAAFLRASAALEPAPNATLRARLPMVSISAAAHVPAPCGLAARAPEPSPVCSWIQSATALAPLQANGHDLRLPVFEPNLEPLPAVDDLVEDPEPCDLAWGDEPEPVEVFVAPVAALGALAPALPVELPALQARIEPFAAFNQPPAPCEVWMRAPQPEPVWSYLRAASAEFAAPAPAVRAPELGVVYSAVTHIPSAGRFHKVPTAEPVMAGVWPRVADIPFEPILAAAAVQLPRIETLAPVSETHGPVVQRPVAAPAAEAAERLLCASQVGVPISAGAGARALPSIAACAPAAGRGRLELAAPVPGPAPQAVESLLVASTALQNKSATVVRLQPFAVAASEGRTVPGFDAPRLAPPASRPPAAARATVRPIATVGVSVPKPAPSRMTPNLPVPGLKSLEFHANRVRGEAVSRLEWKSARFAPLPPRFRVRPIWDRTEDLVAAKPVTKKADIAEVFTLPEAKPRQSRWIGYVAKIAAGIVVVFATWYGASFIKVQRSISVQANLPASSVSDTPSAGRAASAASGAASAVASAVRPQPEPKGVVASVRESIARRAAVQLNDNLREGMAAWGAAGGYPAGWSRHPDGYIRTGSLALFNPTRSYTDYRLEFFGQIETRSMGWTVRAKDEKNYHAMKFTVIEAGLRPVIAMVHYNVVDGKPGRSMQTPLNVMVHNRTPIQVAVDVKGNRFVTSIDGEEVDSYSDDAPASGGVGFFSDAGERARLYWVRVSKNDDWLGHICAFLSGGGSSSTTAEVWPSERPGSPAPWNTGSDSVSLAGAWIAFPYIRASRRPRLSRSPRCQKWNT
ncbi:MAG TPA: hypothetical protein VMS37_00215 [Verrucomicrobiae bacterium]|nr:hypothetical protein [Verrucomicrobiae bacterium]